MTRAELSGVHDCVVTMARDCGDVVVDQVDGTTELRAGTTFATITVTARSVDLKLLLPSGRRLPGIVKLIYGDSDLAEYTLRLRRVEDVDDEVRTWLCEAHAGASR